MSKYPRVSSYKTAEILRDRISELGIELPFDEEVRQGDANGLGSSLKWKGGEIGNRFCILPMEGWDGTLDGKPTELTIRRWKNFGLSGAKLIWGGEAVAVRQDGKANPNQLMMNAQNVGDIEKLRLTLVAEHEAAFDNSSDLLVGLQLTHSGRFARPNEGGAKAPRIAYRHPVLDPRVEIQSDDAILTDDELDILTDDFIAAAKLAQQAGYAFVDIKHCHGYLGHEILSGYDRPGKFGGSFENRTRFLRNIHAGIAAEAPGLEIGVRLSAFDFTPYQPQADGIGGPSATGEYRYAFGGDGTGQGINLDEPTEFLSLLKALDIKLVCTTAGSPYYNPHIQRPATFPPSDGYQPPEDPLVGVARQIAATAELKKRFPELILVGSGYSYLQEWLPHVGQHAVRNGMVDSIGLGRMVLSYPDLPADVLAGETMARKKICRTFSDCTTAPRNGMVSGCYPLDPFYKKRPENELVAAIKKAAK